MFNRMENLQKLIKQAVDDGVTTYKALADAIGRSHAYVQQFVVRGVPRELRERDERVILDMIGAEPRQAPLIPSIQSKNKTAFTPVITPGTELVGQRDFPIFAAAKGGDGHVIVTFDAIEYVKRPAILEGVRDAYGILLTGESMVPAYWPGDMALVHPHLQPSRDSDVVLYHVSPTSEAEAIIKRLVSFNDREWHLKQYNPATDFTESRADWTICHRVVGKYNAR
ncbi:S24 family peptidase [Shinella sp.]|uniref:S24 family peptidase n=1 Tax=Shinella sp. TaxID=1870904 RepID=UPI003F6F4694